MAGVQLIRLAETPMLASRVASSSPRVEVEALLFCDHFGVGQQRRVVPALHMSPALIGNAPGVGVLNVRDHFSEVGRRGEGVSACR